MVSHGDHKMFLHLLSPQTEPAGPPGDRGAFGGRGAPPTPITLLLLPLCSSCQRSLVKEKLLLWDVALIAILKQKQGSVSWAVKPLADTPVP